MTADRAASGVVETAPRRFAGRRKVRLGDVTIDGRLRLDALTRYTQDVSDDDTVDAGLGSDPAWVVRWTAVEARAEAALAEDLSITTHCSGVGSRWAERHLTVTGSAGAHYEVTTLWICVDATSGRPHRLTDRFLAIYESAAGGRKVGAKLVLPGPDSTSGSTSGRWPWALRAVDFDTLGHVNNAAYWAVVEEDRVTRPFPPAYRARLEYGAGLGPGDEVEIVTGAGTGEGTASNLVWWTVAGTTVATASIGPIDPSPAARDEPTSGDGGDRPQPSAG